MLFVYVEALTDLKESSGLTFVNVGLAQVASVSLDLVLEYSDVFFQGINNLLLGLFALTCSFEP